MEGGVTSEHCMLDELVQSLVLVYPVGHDVLQGKHELPHVLLQHPYHIEFGSDINPVLKANRYFS